MSEMKVKKVLYNGDMAGTDPVGIIECVKLEDKIDKFIDVMKVYLSRMSVNLTVQKEASFEALMLLNEITNKKKRPLKH